MKDLAMRVSSEDGEVREFSSRTVLVKPDTTKTVGLGRYDTPQTDADFTIKIQPRANSESLGNSLEMITIPGSSRVVGLYHLHNYGSSDLKVVITRQRQKKQYR